GAHSAQAHAEVGRRAAELKLDQLFTVGKMAGVMGAAARANGLMQVIELGEVETVANAVKHFVRTGDVVLVKASRATRIERVSEVLCGLGAVRVAAARLSLHHLSQRGRGGHGPAGQLVARAEGDRLAQTTEVRPALRRQGGRERRSGRAGVEQERYAHDGGNSYRAGA